LSKRFTIPRTDTLANDPQSALPAIIDATGSEAEAASIMRSLERLGSDPSILFYEMTLVLRGSRHGGVATSAWRVRADRGAPAVLEPQPEV
jgi:hypothetical protein